MNRSPPTWHHKKRFLTPQTYRWRFPFTGVHQKPDTTRGLLFPPDSREASPELNDVPHRLNILLFFRPHPTSIKLEGPGLGSQAIALFQLEGAQHALWLRHARLHGVNQSPKTNAPLLGGWVSFRRVWLKRAYTTNRSIFRSTQVQVKQSVLSASSCHVSIVCVTTIGKTCPLHEYDKQKL